MNIHEAKQEAQKVQQTLSATDPRFSRTVKIVDEDDSILILSYAFAEVYDEYYVIFTEHHGYFVYRRSEVEVTQYNEEVIQQVHLVGESNYG